MTTAGTSGKAPFDVVQAYHDHLADEIPMPIAAILALCDMVSLSNAETTSELMVTIREGCERLKSKLFDPVPAIAGMDLFQRFVLSSAGGKDFASHKHNLVSLAREFAAHTAPSCRERITETAMPFILDDATILTHSYSRVVMQVLTTAAKRYNKRISVYVTEARATGLGLKTYDELTAAGIPCTVILDSAVGFIMNKVDLILTGAEGVVESGGCLNALGTYQIGLIAKAAHKPLYVCAESFKFLRIFPLSQDDLPNSRRDILKFPSPGSQAAEEQKGERTTGQARLMSQEAVEANPAVDYTPPELITFLLTDSGALTPSSGVRDALLAVYGGPD